MKKTLYFLFTFFMVFSLSAQTEQGRMLLGADTEFNMTTFSDLGSTIDGDEPYDDYEPSDVTSTSTAAQLSFGYFVIDNLALGAALNYTSSKTDFNDSDIDNPDPVSTTAYAAFARYYIAGVAFVGASYGMQTSSVYDDWDDEDVPTISLMQGEVGASIFLSDKVAFTPRITYGIQTTKYELYDFVEDKDVIGRDNMGILRIGAGFTIHL